MREIIHARPSEWPNVVPSITGSVSLNSVCSVPPELLPAVFGGLDPTRHQILLSGLAELSWVVFISLING